MPGLGGTGFERYDSSGYQICNFNHGPTLHVICKVHHGSVQCCILLEEPTVKLVTICATTLISIKYHEHMKMMMVFYMQT